MKIFKMINIIIFGFILMNCSYKVPTTASPAVNIYSSNSGKIPGSVVLIIDNNIKTIHREIKPSSYVCGAYNFPISMEKSLEVSIEQTTRMIFQKVIVQNNIPSANQLHELNCNGYIFIQLKQFNPNLRFIPGFFEASVIAKTDIVIEVSITDKEGKNLCYTTVGGSSTIDGDGGLYCSGGATVLEEAISSATKDTMEKYAERVSNSQQVRTCFVDN